MTEKLEQQLAEYRQKHKDGVAHIAQTAQQLEHDKIVLNRLEGAIMACEEALKAIKEGVEAKRDMGEPAAAHPNTNKEEVKPDTRNGKPAESPAARRS